MSNYLIGAYGLANLLLQKRRHVSSQTLINISNNNIILPKDTIDIQNHTVYKTQQNEYMLGIYSPGKYTFVGIGSTNSKCMIKTNEPRLLIYSKGSNLESYDIKLHAPNYKKIKFISENNLILILCYWDYSINMITDIITEFFKDDKIVKIINLTNNLDENWNDILSLTIDNSISNNNFKNPIIEIVDNKKVRNISEILNKYNFEIIYKFFKKINNMKNKDIIDDPKLISIISQDHHDINFNDNNIFIWIMEYLEIFTISSGKFFKYYNKIEDKDNFIKFLIAHKISSLYLQVNTEDELLLINQLNIILNSNEGNHNGNKFIKDAIIEYGLVSQTNINPVNIDKNYNNYYYYNTYNNYNNYYY